MFKNGKHPEPLVEIAKQVLSLEPKDIVLLPNRRSCRTLIQSLLKFSNKKAVLLPNILTFSDMATNKHAFLSACPKLDVTYTPEITEMSLKIITMSVLQDMQVSLSNTDTYLAFLVKFYTFCGDKAKLADHPEALRFITNVEAKLFEVKKALPQNNRRDAVNQIIATWDKASAELQIFAVMPSNMPPYLKIWHDFFQNKPNVKIASDFYEGAKASPTLIECADEIEEANVIAALVKEALHKEKIAIICSDRQMARKIKRALKYWDINPDDTTNSFLLDASITNLFLLISQLLLAKPFSVVSLVALITHPMCKFKIHEELEETIGIFRTPSNYETFAQIYRDYFDGSNLIKELGIIFELCSTINLNTLAQSHWIIFEQLYAGDRNEKQYLVLKEFIEDFIQATEAADIDIANYSSMLKGFLASYGYREDAESNSDVSIMTIQESRLHRFDSVILTSANEGQFPTIKKDGTIIGYSAERELGFPSIDDKILEAQRDFDELLINPKVIITRSLSANNKEQVPSRFIDKLRCNDGNKYLSWVRMMRQTALSKINAPLPIVPLEKRPKKISVSGIEKLMRDPYAYYAQYILKLKPLEPIGIESSKREFGIILHNILQSIPPLNFEKQNYVEECCIQLNNHLGQNKPKQYKFWLEHLKRISEWIWEYENSLPLNIIKQNEIHGFIEIEDIKVTAVADRIYIISKIQANIIDFKTGVIPTNSDIRNGLYPQLPIEALLFANNGFKNISAPHINLYYFKISGKQSAGEEILVACNINSVEVNLRKLIKQFFKNPDQAFFASSKEDCSGKTTKFKHLSRVDEWLGSNN